MSAAAPVPAVSTPLSPTSAARPLQAVPISAYSTFSVAQARWMLGGYLVLTVVLLAIALSPYRNNLFEKPSTGKPGDIRLFLDKVERMRGGANYYDAALIELTSKGYPTSSVFNWRTPIIMELVALLPESGQGRWLIAPFAVCLLVGTLFVLGADREGGALVALLALLFTFTSVVQSFSPEVFILPDTWAGIFIGLSVCAFALQQPVAGVGLGIAAAFLRELALGYALTMACWAILNRRWRELAGWCLSIALFLGWYALHARMVWQTTADSELAPAKSWLVGGGLTFLLATAQMNVLLINWPQWVTALYLSTGLLGLLGWNTPTGRRALVAVGAYQLLFLMAGQPSNQYWGLLVAPLLAWGAARGVVSLGELVAQARVASAASA